MPALFFPRLILIQQPNRLHLVFGFQLHIVLITLIQVHLKATLTIEIFPVAFHKFRI